MYGWGGLLSVPGRPTKLEPIMLASGGVKEVP